MIYLDACRGLNHIGRLGENEHRTVRFWESAEALAMYPEASVTVLHKRPGDPAAYPVAPGYVSIQDGVVCWTIQSGDLARPGRGKVELVFTQGEVVAKTLIWDTMIDQALDGAGEPPEPWESWINEVTAAGEHAPQIIDGEWWAWSVAQEAYINTGVDAQGPQGEQGPQGDDYVITQQDYQAIAAEVAQDAGFQQKVQAAEDAAEDARGWANGTDKNGDPVQPGNTHYENNAKFEAEQAKLWAIEKDLNGHDAPNDAPQKNNSAKHWADAAERSVSNGSYLAFDIDSDGYITMEKIGNFNIDFEIDEDGYIVITETEAV